MTSVLLLLLLTWVLAAAFPRATRGNIMPNPQTEAKAQPTASPARDPNPPPPPPAPSQRGPLKEGLGLEQASQVPGPPVPNTCFKEGWGVGSCQSEEKPPNRLSHLL